MLLGDEIATAQGFAGKDASVDEAENLPFRDAQDLAYLLGAEEVSIRRCRAREAEEGLHKPYFGSPLEGVPHAFAFLKARWAPHAVSGAQCGTHFDRHCLALY